MSDEMTEGYLEVEYRQQKIQVGYVDGLGEWVATSDSGFFEGFSPEEVIEMAKRKIDEEERNE